MAARDDLDVKLMLVGPAMASMIIINPVCGRCGGVATHAMLSMADMMDRIDALTVCETCADRIVRTLDESHLKSEYMWLRPDVAARRPQSDPGDN